MRKYYHIEDAGRRHYETILRDYLSVTNNILKILGRSEIDED